MTAFSNALFYPWIEIEDEGYLKNAILYWDRIQTIVPESIKTPYTSTVGRELFDYGILSPLFVNPDMREIRGLTEDVIKYIDSQEGREVLTSSSCNYRYLPIDKIPADDNSILRLHAEKLSHEVEFILRRTFNPKKDQDWIFVNDRFANFYMTLLATNLAESKGIGLLTNLPTTDKLAEVVKLDNRLSVLGLQGRQRRNFDWDYHYRANYIEEYPRELAQGVLMNLAFKKIWIAPDTPIDKILDFKEKYSDELGIFRNKISGLTESISDEANTEAVIQKVSDIYNNDFVPEMNNFKRALDSTGIKWVMENMLKISYFATPATSIPIILGLTVPQALLVGAGISLIASTVLYNIDKKEKLRENPYSYLLRAEKEFR